MIKIKLFSLLTPLVVIAITASATPAAAAEYPWCAQYTGGQNGGGRNCGFSSYAQCMDTVHGIGGFCEPNLFYLDQSKQPTRYRHRRRD